MFISIMYLLIVMMAFLRISALLDIPVGVTMIAFSLFLV